MRPGCGLLLAASALFVIGYLIGAGFRNETYSLMTSCLAVVLWAVSVGLGVSGLLRLVAGQPVPVPVPPPLAQPVQLQTREGGVVPVVYTFSVPKALDWNSTRAVAFMKAMLTQCPVIVFRIVAMRERIVWQVVDLTGVSLGVLKHIVMAHYPEVELVLTPADDAFPPFFYRRVLSCTQQYVFPAPLLRADEMTGHDPLDVLTQAMNVLEADERVIYTLYCAGGVPDVKERAIPEMYMVKEDEPKQSSGVSEAMLAVYLLSGQGGVARNFMGTFVPAYKWAREKRERENRPVELVPIYEMSIHRVMETKTAQPIYFARLLVELDTVNPARMEALVTLGAHLAQFSTERLNKVSVHVPPSSLSLRSDELEDIEWTSALSACMKGNFGTMLLEASEFASLWHLPTKAFGASRIAWVRKTVPLPEDMRRNIPDAVTLGINRVDGKDVLARLPYANRNTHLYVIGKTRMGKSNYIHHLIHQDIANGKGVAVIDPHGELVRDILRWSIPLERELDVVLLDIADVEHPVPLNLLAVPPSFDSETAIVQVMSVLRRYGNIEDTITLGPTLENAVALLQGEPTPTMHDIERLFEDEQYLYLLWERNEEPSVRKFWKDFREKPKHQRDQTIAGVNARVNALYKGRLRPLTCHPEMLDFRSCHDRIEYSPL